MSENMQKARFGGLNCVAVPFNVVWRQVIIVRTIISTPLMLNFN